MWSANYTTEDQSCFSIVKHLPRIFSNLPNKEEKKRRHNKTNKTKDKRKYKSKKKIFKVILQKKCFQHLFSSCKPRSEGIKYTKLGQNNQIQNPLRHSSGNLGFKISLSPKRHLKGFRKIIQ